MKFKINGHTLLLKISVQSQLDHLFSSYLAKLFKPYFIHTFIHHTYLISLLERNLNFSKIL